MALLSYIYTQKGEHITMTFGDVFAILVVVAVLAGGAWLVKKRSEKNKTYNRGGEGSAGAGPDTPNGPAN
jgi:hypothetical protein